MLNRILSYLFKNDGSQRYEPHPSQVLWSVFFMAIGVVSVIRDGWELFGIIVFVQGVALGFTIIFAINWEKSTQYWETINRHVDLMNRSKNPDLWKALGYNNAPDTITIEEVKQDDLESGWTKKIKTIPISPTVMNMVANKVLLTGDTSFTEERFKDLVPNFRRIQKQMKKLGYISQNSSKNYRLGYSFNRKGMETVYEYASDAVKLQLEKEKNARLQP